jgi:MFS family permease
VFLVVWAGQLLSKLGSGISAFALGVYLYQKSGSSSSYSFLLLCAFIPSIILAPLGGILADRVDRRLMMIVGDIGSATGIILTIVMLQVLPDRDWPIYLGVAISSLFVSIHSPAFKALTTDLLDEKEYAKASGLIQLAEASRYLFAPVIAAVLMSRVSISFVLAIDVLTFVGAALTAVLVRKIAIQRRNNLLLESFYDGLACGIRYILANRFIFNLMWLTSVVTFFTGILQSLFVPMVLSLTDAATLGNIQSFGASGMLLGSLFIGCRNKRNEQMKVLKISLFIAGIFCILVGGSTTTGLIAFAFFCFLLALPFVNTSLEVLFRQNIDNALQGRVWSLISLVSQLGMLVAFSAAGFLADRIFNPLFMDQGCLANTVGIFIGTGMARGNGLLIIISGVLLSSFALFTVFDRKVGFSQNGEQAVKLL